MRKLNIAQHDRNKLLDKCKPDDVLTIWKKIKIHIARVILKVVFWQCAVIVLHNIVSI